MRRLATASTVRRVLAALADAATGPGDVFLAGGATAVLIGWRETTLDIDLKFDPEPPGVFAAIPAIKDTLDVNIELAAPDDFIPPLPDWRERSLPIEARGSVRFFHYDLRMQALAKIERGHAQDLQDVRALLGRGLVTRAELSAGLRAIEPGLARYPAIDPGSFRRKVEEFAPGRSDG